MEVTLPRRDYDVDIDYLLLPNGPEMPLVEQKDKSYVLRWGQRKLALMLIQFLSRFWNRQQISNLIVVYVGAVPEFNIDFAIKLFPGITWHLYDANTINVKPSERVKVYQRLFTDQDAKQWANRNDVFFISDIRQSVNTKTMSTEQINQKVEQDMRLQEKWYNIIKPVRAQLKFRVPFAKEGMIGAQSYTYLDGLIFKQPWVSPLSPEFRLVPSGPSKTRTYDLIKQMRLAAYHHIMIRRKQKYTYPLKPDPIAENTVSCDDSDLIDPLELLDDWDSRTEAQIWMDYLGQFDQSRLTAQWVSVMSRSLTKHLLQYQTKIVSIDGMRNKLQTTSKSTAV